MTETPRLGITLGDPAGIGPEIIVRTFSKDVRLPDAAYVIFGSGRLLDEEAKALGLAFAPAPYPSDQETLKPGLYLYDPGFLQGDVVKGRPSAEGGRASFAYFEKAVEEARSGRLAGIVTAPISKQAWGMAGLKWRGHTEYLTRLYPCAIMAFWSDKLKVALLSHHVPLKEALSRVRTEVLQDFFTTLQRSLKRLSAKPFRFLVAGLNPHAGEGGLMGSEEAEIVTAVARARAAGMDIEGPCPPDTVFRRALGRPEVMVVALYHDQGLIPFKLEAFENGVNFTLGLPFVRTSPDHGTAYDIAPLRTAEAGSFIQAVLLAAEFCRRPAGTGL